MTEAKEQIAPVSGGASMMLAWRVQGRRVLVVGGGAVAVGRVRAALEADARVVVVAPQVHEELAQRHASGEIRWEARRFVLADLMGAAMVLVAIDDHQASRRIAAAARARHIPINVADDIPLCDFWFTSVHREGPVQIAVTSNSQAPALAARIRRRVARALPARLGEAAARFGELRRRVRQRSLAPAGDARRMGWLTEIGRRWDIADIADLEEDSMEALVGAYLRGEEPPGVRRQGEITLVGAGPGRPDLMTVAAREALERADLVIADRICSPALLELVSGELRVARKYPGRAAEAQVEVNQWMLDGVRAGKRVVRLKCGDPFVFGRGGEELRFLAGHGIQAAVIPGVSSALAAPLAAGIPVTHRGLANRVTVMTAVARENVPLRPPPFDAGTTVVVLMGVRRLPDLVREMLEGGYPPSWPVAIVERGTWRAQRTTTATLSSIVERAREAEVSSPATVVVGEVAAFPAALAEATPLIQAS